MPSTRAPQHQDAICGISRWMLQTDASYKSEVEGEETHRSNSDTIELASESRHNLKADPISAPVRLEPRAYNSCSACMFEKP